MKKYIKTPKWLTILIFILALSLAAGCSKSSDTITIASKQFTENIILSEMYAQLVESHTDLKVERKQNLGGTSVIFPAMQNKEIDVYVEYSGTVFNEILKKEYNTSLTADEIYNTAKSGLKDDYNITMLQPIGINNTFALGMLRSVAEKRNIASMSDLSAHTPELRFGANHLFFTRDADGYDAMLERYSYQFKAVEKMDVSLLYEAIDQNQLDVIVIYSTDSLLIKYDMVILEDDDALFPPYYGAPIVRNAVLEKHPSLKDVLDKLSGLIDDQTMQQLDYEVDIEHKTPADVAKTFLTTKGLLK